MESCPPLCEEEIKLLFFSFADSFIEVDSESSKDAECHGATLRTLHASIEYNEKLADEPASVQEDSNEEDGATENVQKNSEEVQLSISQDPETKRDGEDAADEWQNISLVRILLLSCIE